jgi:hypothetical protein
MPNKDWTVLVYMGADDSDDAELVSAAFKDLEEMRRVGSSDRVNVAVQMDLNLFAPVRFLIRPDGTLDVTRSRGLGLRRESSTGRPGALSNFLTWATQCAPATRYLLILWGHGLGVGLSVEIEQTNADVLFDADDALTIPELAGVLRRFRRINGAPLDILGFDACYMSTAEVAREADGLVELMIGSQITLPFQGWPYEPILKHLRAHPKAGPEKLAKVITRTVVGAYPTKATVTQTALRPAGAKAVTSAVQTLVKALDTGRGDKQEARRIKIAFDGAKYLGPRQFLDLMDLCHRLRTICRDPAVRTAARATATTLNQKPNGLIFAHNTRGKRAAGLNGASIYVSWVTAKNGEEKVNLDLNDYNSLRFVRATGWQLFNDRFKQRLRTL